MKAVWLVWSNQHKQWWRPNNIGYTSIMDRAGRYTLENAKAICESSYEHTHAAKEPEEVMVPAPEFFTQE